MVDHGLNTLGFQRVCDEAMVGVWRDGGLRGGCYESNGEKKKNRESKEASANKKNDVTENTRVHMYM